MCDLVFLVLVGLKMMGGSGGYLLSYSGRRRDWISWATAGLAPKLARGIEVVIVGGLVVSLRVVEKLKMLRGAL